MEHNNAIPSSIALFILESSTEKLEKLKFNRDNMELMVCKARTLYVNKAHTKVSFFLFFFFLLNSNARIEVLLF